MPDSSGSVATGVVLGVLAGIFLLITISKCTERSCVGGAGGLRRAAAARAFIGSGVARSAHTRPPPPSYPRAAYIVVREKQQVVLERCGRFRAVLTPGIHCIMPYIDA